MARHDYLGSREKSELPGSCVNDREPIWIGLWEIVAYVAEDLGVEESEQQLELTVALVKGLLKRGLCAGDLNA